MYTGTIPKSADWIVFMICSLAELTLQNQPIFFTRAIVLLLIWLVNCIPIHTVYATF